MQKVGIWFLALLMGLKAEPIKWRINLPDIPLTETSTMTSFPFTIPSSSDSSSKIHLVDWREWKRMRPSYSATIGAPPLLIVDSSFEQKEFSSEIPEAFDEDEKIISSNESTTTTTTFSTTTTTQIPLITTTTQILSTTTIELSNSTEEIEQTTTPKHTPDVTLELRNLPDILSLLKHLSLIPAVVRSFSNAAIPSSPSTDSFPSTSSNQLGSIISPGNPQQSAGLNSRALSANSGYNARTPQFVTASPADSETPQTLMGRRPSQLPPNMPAPIVPMNNRQEAMKPKEIGNSIRDLNHFPPSHRLNIYGIDSQLTPTRENPALERDSTLYNAPMIQTPQNPEISTRKQRPRFDLSNLTVNEVEQLESIHRKLFQTPPNLTSNLTERVIDNQIDSSEPKIQQPSPLPLSEGPMNPVFVFQKPTEEKSHNPLTSGLMATTSSLNSSLKPEMLNELMMIKDIPDLEELTKGMDLSLLSKPGGFALLKEQFIERLIQRTVVQKRRMRKVRRNRRRY